MLTGFNTDVTYEGTVYHVQSEDRGLENPIIDSLVYCGGQILHQYKDGYQDLVDEGLEEEQLERRLAARLEAQHWDLVRRARHGEFVPGGPPTLPSLMPEEGTLEEDLDRLLSAAEVEALRLSWQPRAGKGPGLSGYVEVRRADDSPAGSARVSVRLVSTDLDPATLLDGETDEGGRLSVALALPPLKNAAVILGAATEDAAGRLRLDLIELDGLPALIASEAPDESPAPAPSS